MRGTLLAIVVLSLGAVSLARTATHVPGLDHLDHLLSVVETRYRTTPDPSDVRAQARRLGHDPQRIRAFVRDEIAFEPYEGSLRGASGTLFARAGNALDQALLLVDLLAASGVEARIVGRDLGADEGRGLVELFVRRDGDTDDPPPQVELAARDLGVPLELVQAVVRERTAVEAALLGEVLEGAEREVARLWSMLADRLGSPEFTPPSRHAWVEVAGEPFDPTGDAVALEGGRVVSAADLEAARTTLVFRLVLERSSGSTIETEDLLEVALPADALAYRPVDVIVYPDPGEMPDALQLMVMTPSERAEVLRAVSTFRSGLLVDGRRYGGAPFDLQGQLLEVSGDGRVSAATAVGQATGGLLGGAFGGGRSAPTTALHALRVEVSVQAPNGAERLHVRTLFRAGEAPVPLLRDSFLIETHVLPAGEGARRALGVMARNAPAIRALFLGTAGAVALEAETEVAPLLLRYADARRRLLASLGAVPLYGGVGIIRESRQVLLHDEDERLAVRHVIDLMDMRYAFLTGDGRYAQATALHAGVAETALEWLLVLRANPADVDADRSAWTLLDRARLVGSEVTVAEEAGEVRVRWAEDAWWGVDPRTGLGIGRVHEGAGQGLVEYGWMVTEKICEAMGSFFSLLGELEVQGQGLSDMEKLCATRDILTSLGSDVESLLEVGHVDFIEQQLRDKGLGHVDKALDVQQQLFDGIQAETRALWRSAASALAGW